MKAHNILFHDDWDFARDFTNTTKEFMKCFKASQIFLWGDFGSIEEEKSKFNQNILRSY